MYRTVDSLVLPTYGGTVRSGKLAVQLDVIHGGPLGHKSRPSVRLLLTIEATNGKMVVKTKTYAQTGHIFRYSLRPGKYKINVRLLPPVVNPERRCMEIPNVVIRSQKQSLVNARCVLVG